MRGIQFRTKWGVQLFTEFSKFFVRSEEFDIAVIH